MYIVALRTALMIAAPGVINVQKSGADRLEIIAYNGDIVARTLDIRWRDDSVNLPRIIQTFNVAPGASVQYACGAGTPNAFSMYMDVQFQAATTNGWQYDIQILQTVT